MTAMRERRLLGLRLNAPEWRTLERAEGFRVFERSFLAFPHRMVVVRPDFANFASKYKQSFAYLPLSAFAPSGSPAPERDSCADALRGFARNLPSAAKAPKSSTSTAASSAIARMASASNG